MPIEFQNYIKKQGGSLVVIIPHQIVKRYSLKHNTFGKFIIQNLNE